MSKTVIKVENLGKQYRLGQIGTGTLAHDLNRRFHKIMGKEDPYLKLGESNDRTQKGNSNLVWALKDLNFEIEQGEILGIVGKNGAGKSTLLKILSKVTTPTTGSVKIKGRLASLLEVGTGFHPDLTGKENIFLNGAILGMTKAEIKSKFDEIVDFSGVERYIDTPVKRYSSGMYVRLAFAVAAHLEPEILVVDEVLSVGDVEFQKKCLGKMKDVSGQGRTVLFVSHNMPAVKALCSRGVLIENGRLVSSGGINEIIKTYFTQGNQNYIWKKNESTQKSSNKSFSIHTISFRNLKGETISELNISEDVFVDIAFEVIEENSNVNFSLVISDGEGTELFGSLNNLEPNYYGKKMEKGFYTASCKIYGNLFNNIDLLLTLIAFGSHGVDSFVIENALKIKAIDDGILKGDYSGEYGGFLRPKFDWVTKKQNDLKQ